MPRDVDLTWLTHLVSVAWSFAGLLEGTWEFDHLEYMCFVESEGPCPRGDPAEGSVGVWGARAIVPILLVLSVGVSLRQGCPFSPILFVISMDRISRSSQVVESIQFMDFRTVCLLFADDMVPLASADLDLQHALGWFAPGMGVSTFKCVVMVLCQKMVVCSLWVKSDLLCSK